MLAVDELPGFLDNLAIPEPAVATVAGYRVNVQYSALEESEQRARLEALRSVVGRSLKKLSGEDANLGGLPHGQGEFLDEDACGGK